MAAPFVAGVAGLIKETVGDKMRMTEIRNIILETANIEINNSEKNMVNAEAAMREALRRLGYNIPSKNEKLSSYEPVTITHKVDYVINDKDTIVFANPVYDGMEKTATKIYDDISKLGANIVPLSSNVRSYHASSEDLMLMINLMQPKY